MWRWLQVLEQERHQLRLRLEEVEDEQQQRLLELAADAAALRWVRRRIYQDLSGSITTIEHVPSMFHFVSKSDLSTGQHWSALRAMQGWLKDRSNTHLNSTNICVCTNVQGMHPCQLARHHLTPSDSSWLHLNHTKCSDKPIGGWPDRAEPATGRSTQVI